MPDDVDALLSRAQDRLAAAKELLRLEMWDDAANRAYYAMFEAARALLLARDSEPRTHKGVFAEFGRRYVEPGDIDEATARAFREARDLRERADYAFRVSVGEDEAQDIVAEAEAFVAKAVSVLGR